MSVELTGKFIEALVERSGVTRTGANWRCKDFIMEMGDQYPRKVCVSVWNDKIDILNQFLAGDDVKVAVDIESREYNGKWYTSLKAWQLEKVNSQPAEPQQFQEIPPHQLTDIPPEEESDDLPF